MEVADKKSIHFTLGRILATPVALRSLQYGGENAHEFLARHARGDWGEVCNDDKAINNQALIDGDRLVSSYILKSGEKIWVITEADRSATTMLLPEEY
jgi:hypothetical protein